jgi:hypothetical protein
MARNDEVEAGAKAIARDFELPGGRRAKLARVVARHLDWFEAAEARGMTWDDMIAVLAAAGARRPNGLPLSRGTLSSTVWRKRNDVAADEAPSDRPPVRGRATRTDTAQLKSRSGQNKPDLSRAKQASNVGRAPASQLSRPNVPSKADVPHSAKVSNSNGRKRRAGAGKQLDAGGEGTALRAGRNRGSSASSDVLAFMKRAAKLRQRHNDG